MKVILIDDERAMHLIMSKMLQKLPGIEISGAFTDTQSAARFLKENPDVELAFVDLSMPGETGMEFAARMEAVGCPTQLVFVTSHKEYALEAYDLSVLDYIVKPVTQERLQRAISRATKHRRAPSQAEEPAKESGGGTGRTGSPTVVLTMLGDIAVSTGAGRVKWISRKCTELFAYLLLHRGKRIPRFRLVADIFAGTGADSYLNTTVYQLRKSLEPLGLRDALRSENDGYALELGNEPITDYLEFERQTRELRSIHEGNVEAALLVERLYTGELFGDRAYVWAVHETERYSAMHASFVLKLAEALIAMNDMTAASRLLLKLNERNPLDESAVRLLMAIHARSSDKKGLNAIYTGYVRLLGRELGIRPPNELILFFESLVKYVSEKQRSSG
ncbi:response regulator receiver and SARP domain protein [Paenibacillaceae bacterium GAS479]|nr:response regulator receiver and SARP domain protein [Paenibacillaceae bacterium GAS479]